MKKIDIIKIIRIDMTRAFFSYKFLVSIFLGIGVCYFTLLFCGDYKSETIHKFIMLHDRSQSFLAYIVGIFSYALCFYDDFLYGNIKNVIGRIGINEYVFSKALAGILSTITAFLLGKLGFAVLYSIDTPVCLPETLSRIPASMMYIDFIKSGNYFGYFFFSSFQRALYCGILCQIVMLVSIMIPNKAVVFCLPIAIFYVCNFYINNSIRFEPLNYSRIFDGITRIFDNDLYGMEYAILVALITCWILYRFTVYVVRKKVYYE